jgi:hypothetical protein
MKSLFLLLLAAASAAMAADVPLVTFYFDDPSPNTVAPFTPSATAKEVKAGPIERGTGFIEGDALPGVDEYQKPSAALSGKVDLQIPLNKTPDSYDLLYVAGEGATHAGNVGGVNSGGFLVYQVRPLAATQQADTLAAATAHALDFFFPVSAVGADVTVTSIAFRTAYLRDGERVIPRQGQWEVALDDGRDFQPFGDPVQLVDPAAPADSLVEKKVKGRPFTIPAGKTALFRFTAYGSAEHSDSGQPFVLDDITLGGTVGPGK